MLHPAIIAGFVVAVHVGLPIFFDNGPKTPATKIIFLRRRIIGGHLDAH